MMELIAGFVAASVLFTWFPTLGAKLSEWLRTAWEWIKSRTGIGVAKHP